MFLGKVVGTVWSTKKTPDLEGVRFLIVHPYDLDHGVDLTDSNSEELREAARSLGRDNGQR